MATTRRRKALTIIEQAESEPYRFQFFQAVRVIERAALRAPDKSEAQKHPLNLLAPPSKEFIRFGTRQSLNYSPSDVTQVFKRSLDNENEDSPTQWQMTIAFMGLTGSQGVLPHFLSEAILREIREKNWGLHDFFEIFNHRAISMMYRAWAKYQLPATYESHQLHKHNGPDAISHVLLSLIGLGLPSLQYRQPYPDESLLSLSGLLSRNICTAVGLSSAIRHWLGLEVEIKQFAGTISELTDDTVSKLGFQNAQLGISTFIGSRCLHSAGKFTVSITPETTEERNMLAPGSALIRSLMSFIRTTVGSELEFDLEITQSKEQISSAQLGAEAHCQPILGWNILLGSPLSTVCMSTEQILSVRMSSEILPPDDTLPLAS